MTGATAHQKATGSGGINPWQRQAFLSLYSNRDRHIYKQKSDPSWKVSRFRLATGLIDAAISTECDTFYGSFWGEQTSFAVLDIDADSSYHNVQELKQLRQRLARIGLSGNLLFRSSKSGGWHLYVPFNEPATSKDAEQTLKAWLKSQGYDIRGGQLEVFPCGNGLRLPLQFGFAWLNENAEVASRREELTTEEALTRFMLDLKAAANDWSYAKTLIDSQVALAAAAAAKDAQARQERLETGDFEHLFSAGRIIEHWEKGRKFWQEGLTSAGQRHDAVLYVGHYLWYGDSENGIAALPGARNDEYRARLIEAWLSEKHNGFCRHIDQNKWEEIKAQIKRAVLWRGDGQAREYEPYRLTDRLLKRLLAIFRKTGKVWTVEDFKQANDDRQEEARRKIRVAVAQCLEEGRQISRSTLEALTGCSPNTLKKHADLWKLFAIGSREYNRGGSGGVGLVRSLLAPKTSLKLLDLSGGSVGPDDAQAEENFDLVLCESDSGCLPAADQAAGKVCGLAPLAVPKLLALESKTELALVERANARIVFSVFDSLRSKLSGATANNSTACKDGALTPSLPPSLATGSNTGALSAVAPSAGGSSLGLAVCSLNGFLPSSAEPPPGPLHLPQTGFSFYGSSVRQSNRMWWQLGWLGVANLGAHFCLSSMNFCRTASRWASSSSCETTLPRASDSSASSIARRNHCSFISSRSCSCASGVRFSTSLSTWSKVVCSSGLR